jgi:hypothetical protein
MRGPPTSKFAVFEASAGREPAYSPQLSEPPDRSFQP